MLSSWKKIPQIKRHAIVGAIICLGMLIYSFFAVDSVLDFMSRTVIMMLFASALNIILGFGGLRPLGMATYFGMGSYAYVILVVRLGWAKPLAIIGAMALAMLISLGVNILCLRANDDLAFAFMSMGINTLLFTMVYKIPYVGSDTGLTGNVRLAFASSSRGNFYLSFGISVVCIVLIYLFYHILNGVNLSVEEGTSVCLLGRNGVGKSTTMKTIMGMLNPKEHCKTEGSITFNGKELVGMQSHAIARLGIAYVPQGRHIFPTLTTEENLRVAARKGVDGSDKWNLESVYKFFPRLEERKDSKGDKLSGGEKQMLAVARGLMQNPKMMLLDEITEGLAPIIVDQLAVMVQNLLAEGVTILIAEQNVKFATKVSSDCYILERGAVVHHQATQDLSEETRKQYLGL